MKRAYPILRLISGVVSFTMVMDAPGLTQTSKQSPKGTKTADKSAPIPHLKRFILTNYQPEHASGGESTRVLFSKGADGGVNTSVPTAAFRQPMSLSFGANFNAGTARSSYNDGGAEHVIMGTVTIEGYTLESDDTYPLSFKLIANRGDLLLCGRGTITTPDGKIEKVGTHDTPELWLSLMKSKDSLDRQSACEALGYLSTTDQAKSRATSALVSALRDSVRDIRRDAAEALGRIGGKQAIEGLAFAYQDADGWVSGVAKECLTNLHVALSSVLSVQQRLTGRWRQPGTWSRDGDLSLRLGADGSFSWGTGEGAPSGKWSYADQKVILVTDKIGGKPVDEYIQLLTDRLTKNGAKDIPNTISKVREQLAKMIFYWNEKSDTLSTSDSAKLRDVFVKG